MSADGARWGALAAEVRTRREWLHLSHHGVTQRGGPSHETVRLVEVQGRAGFRAQTLVQLDRGLGWRQGTARAIVNGTAPVDRNEWVSATDDRRTALSLREVSDLALAGEVVGRITRRADSEANRRLLVELAGWMERDMLTGSS